MQENLTQPKQFESPISIVVPAGTSQTISFPQTFFGFGVSIILTNLDGAAIATYRINGATQPLLTMLGGDFRTLSGVRIDLLEINAAIGGDFQVQVVRLPLIGAK